MINFKSKADFDSYLTDKWLRFVDNGSEGKFYISSVDGMGYKILDRDEFQGPLYDPNKIIMNDEVNIDSFIFPDSLLTINGALYGYVSEVVRDDLFGSWMEAFFIKDRIDYKKLKSAYQKFKNDVFLLTEKKIKIYDLANNLLFDGEKMYAIDTCSYRYSKESDLLIHNMQALEDAMDVLFVLLSVYSERIVLDREKTGLSILQHIDYIEKTLKKCVFPQNKQKALEPFIPNKKVIF